LKEKIDADTQDDFRSGTNTASAFIANCEEQHSQSFFNSLRAGVRYIHSHISA